MIKKQLGFVLIGFLLIGACSNLLSKDIQLKQLVGFETEPAHAVSLDIHLYEKLNIFKEDEGLVFDEMSYLLSLLKITGESARFRFKGVYEDGNVSISANSLNLNAVNGPLMNYISLEEVYLINDIENDKASVVFNATPIDSCTISMILYHDNKATYLTTSDSFGIYLGEEDTMSECHQTLNNDIKLIDKLPVGVKDRDIKQTEKLAHLLNDIKNKHQLTNSQIGKMIAMSNIDIGIKALTYPAPYQTDNLIISHNGYQLINDSENNEVTVLNKSTPKMIVFSTNHNNETVLLGSTELEKLNDLKLVIYKQGSSYLYNINNMKHKTVIQD